MLKKNEQNCSLNIPVLEKTINNITLLDFLTILFTEGALGKKLIIDFVYPEPYTKSFLIKKIGLEESGFEYINPLPGCNEPPIMISTIIISSTTGEEFHIDLLENCFYLFDPISCEGCSVNGCIGYDCPFRTNIAGYSCPCRVSIEANGEIRRVKTNIPQA